MEPYEIVEMLDDFWGQLPKNLPLVGSCNRKATFKVLLPVGGLRVFALLAVGVRGGIDEQIFVIDPTQAIVADQLIVCCTDGGGSGRGALLPLAELRHQVLKVPDGRRELALKICDGAMWDFLDRLDTSPLDPTQLRHIESTSQSLSWIGVTSGGAPSRGGRSGGGR